MDVPVPSSAAKETPALEDRASAAPVTPTKKKVAKKRAAEQEQDAVGQNVPALALKARDNETPAEIAELQSSIAWPEIVDELDDAERSSSPCAAGFC